MKQTSLNERSHNLIGAAIEIHRELSPGVAGISFGAPKKSLRALRALRAKS